MKRNLFLLCTVILLFGGIAFPQHVTHAGTTTYVTCPAFATLQAEAATPGTITFNVSGTCTVVFGGVITINNAVVITNVGGTVIFDGDINYRHFDVAMAGSLTLENII